MFDFRVSDKSRIAPQPVVGPAAAGASRLNDIEQSDQAHAAAPAKICDVC
jgi:hypothetical protein